MPSRTPVSPGTTSTAWPPTPAEAWAVPVDSPGRGRPRCRTPCGSSSTGTTVAPRARARCGRSSPRASPSPPGPPGTCSSTGPSPSPPLRARAAGRGSGGSGGGSGGVPRFGGFLQWSLPFGAVSAVNWIALVGQRRVHEFGLTREQLGPRGVERSAQRRPQPQGHLPRADDPRRLHGGPDDLLAPVPVRLRCPLRRIDGVGRLPRGLRPGRRRIPPAMSTPWAPPCGGVPVGTSSTT